VDLWPSPTARSWGIVSAETVALQPPGDQTRVGRVGPERSVISERISARLR